MVYKFLVGKRDVNTVKQLKTCNGSFVYKSIELESWKITDYKNFKIVNILIWVEHFLAAQGIMKQKKKSSHA